MARNKTSQFGAADGLFSVGSINNSDTSRDTQEVHAAHDTYEVHEESEIQEEQETQNTHEVQMVQEVHGTGINTRKTIGSTQGKTGEKLKRINLAFSDKNHDYVRLESRRRGKSITQFVNEIIEEYRLSDKGRISDSEIR